MTVATCTAGPGRLSLLLVLHSAPPGVGGSSEYIDRRYIKHGAGPSKAGATVGRHRHLCCCWSHTAQRWTKLLILKSFTEDYAEAGPVLHTADCNLINSGSRRSI